MKIVFILCIFLNLIFNIGHGYKILGVFPTMAKSHFIIGSALLKGLAERGHDVTVIGAFHLNNPPKNYREISMPKIIELSKDILNNILEHTEQNVLDALASLFDLGVILTNTTFEESTVKELINSKEKFDVVILEIFINEAMLGFGQVFNAPVIGVSTFGASAWTCDLVGSPSPPSYVPHPFLSFTDHMTFLQRLGNLAINTFENLYMNFIYLPKQEEIYNKHFPDPKPSFREIRKNVSLVFLNSHVSLGYPRPYMPNMIEVGGLHLNRNSKPLPADMKKFIESAKDGVIYFSMGSNLKSKILPKDKRDAILNAFKSLKQKVLWKWEDKELPGKPDNVLINEWFPQDDILAHPNVKVFITHGGLLSTTEAIYHGVPVIGIPMFGDQFLNMGRAVKAGYGLMVDYKELTEDKLKGAINEMLSNKKYSENIKLISDKYRDQQMNPLDKAIYWVEYIIRHKGAPHLHSGGQELSFIEYHNIDIISIIVAVVFLMLYLIVAMVKSLFNLIGGKPKNVQEKKKTQ